MPNPIKEGGLEAPKRKSWDWKKKSFYDERDLFLELERVFDICHGCRRCFNLCNAFPLLFDMIDSSSSGELDGVNRNRYWDIVSDCYLCDMCFMAKCPYIPPHPFNIDFPGLMLRAKAIRFKKKGLTFRDRIISNTDLLGKLSSIPIIAPIVNLKMRIPFIRWAMEKIVNIHSKAKLPKFNAYTLRQRMSKRKLAHVDINPGTKTTARVVLFSTCYINYNMPNLGEDIIKVFEHNSIKVVLAKAEICCGMPKLELGDINSVVKSIDYNTDILYKFVNDGWDIVIPMPSCAFMVKEVWPLLKNDDKVNIVSQRAFDPFEYLMKRHSEGLLNLSFVNSLGKISLHIPCHSRAQNMGMKTYDFLSLIPNTSVSSIERCSGHNGTYSFKSESHIKSMKICEPVAKRVKNLKSDCYSSDCPMAAKQIENCLSDDSESVHPFTLARKAYGI